LHSGGIAVSAGGISVIGGNVSVRIVTLFDLSGINHTTGVNEGLRLPQTTLGQVLVLLQVMAIWHMIRHHRDY